MFTGAVYLTYPFILDPIDDPSSCEAAGCISSPALSGFILQAVFRLFLHMQGLSIGLSVTHSCKNNYRKIKIDIQLNKDRQS